MQRLISKSSVFLLNSITQFPIYCLKKYKIIFADKYYKSFLLTFCR